MTEPLRIALANDDPAMCRAYESALARLGHHACVAHSGRQLVDQCRLLRPDLVIARAGLPDPDGVTAAQQVCRDLPTPVILSVEGHDAGMIERICDNPYILACLFEPIQEANLGAVIAVVMSRFEQFQSSKQEIADLRQALADRKVIERAKGALTKYTGLAEEEAYRSMRKLASQENRKLPEVAQAVVAAEDVLRRLAQAGESPEAERRPHRPPKGGRASPDGEGLAHVGVKSDRRG